MVDGHGEERRLHGQLLLLMFPVLHGVDRFDQVVLAGADTGVLDVFTASEFLGEVPLSHPVNSAKF